MTLSLSRCVALAALVAAVFAAGCKKNKSDPASDSNPNAPSVVPGPAGGTPSAGGPPAGWSEARDTVGGYKVYLPGRTHQVDLSKAGGQELRPTNYSHDGPPEGTRVSAVSILPPAGVKLGGGPDDLFAGLKAFNRTLDTFYDVAEKTTVQLGGKSALKVVLKPKPWDRPKSPFEPDPEFAKEEAEREKKKEAVRTVVYVTTTATRLIIINVKSPGEPDPALLKTITDSFSFL